MTFINIFREFYLHFHIWNGNVNVIFHCTFLLINSSIFVIFISGGSRVKLQIIYNCTKNKHHRKPASLEMHEGVCLIKDKSYVIFFFYSIQSQRTKFKKGTSGYKIII